MDIPTGICFYLLLPPPTPGDGKKWGYPRDFTPTYPYQIIKSYILIPYLVEIDKRFPKKTFVDYLQIQFHFGYYDDYRRDLPDETGSNLFVTLKLSSTLSIDFFNF